jgi:hypothetical protein
MANSTSLITDLGTVKTNGFSTTTLANALAAAGKIQDMNGNLQGCIVGLYDVKRRLTEMIADVDAGSDGTNLGLMNNVNASLS